jgi:hypothetical protein
VRKFKSRRQLLSQPTRGFEFTNQSGRKDTVRALFTGGQPPRPLLTDLHGVLDDLVDQLGIIVECSDQAVGVGDELGVPAGVLEGIGDDVILGRLATSVHLIGATWPDPSNSVRTAILAMATGSGLLKNSI